MLNSKLTDDLIKNKTKINVSVSNNIFSAYILEANSLGFYFKIASDQTLTKGCELSENSPELLKKDDVIFISSTIPLSFKYSK